MFMRDNKVISHSIRLSIGCIFVLSAVLKYLAIDVFDLYIYEHNIFNLAVSSTLTRLLIAAEFSLGILLITNILMRFTYVTTFVFLISFTVYLLLQPYLFNVQLDNCFCFGDKIVLNHMQSIIKNIVLLLFLSVVNVKFYKKRKFELPVFFVIALLSVTGFMVLNAPDYLYTKLYHSEVRIDEPLYEKALKDTDKYTSFTSGKKLICMYSHQCKYCKNSIVKIDRICKGNAISSEHIKCVFWNVADSNEINMFFVTNNVDILEYTIFSVDDFLKITHGQMPVILFSDHGKIIKSLQYAGLTEHDIIQFLSKE